MKIACLAAVAASAVAGPAFAADISGPRVEGIIGYDDYHPAVIAGRTNDDVKGVTYGIGVGYDFSVGSKLSLGVDAEISDSSGDTTGKAPGMEWSLSLKRDLYAGVRITTAVSDNFNLYGKIGYTNQRQNQIVTLDNGTTTASAYNSDGIRAGIGGQLMLTDKIYTGVEYRYSNYGWGRERHQVAATMGFRF